MGTPRCTHPTRRGIVLRELVIAVGAVALLGSMLAIMGAGARQAGMLGQDMHKLRNLGGATYAFALDNNDDLWTFNWKGGVMYNTPYPDLNFATTDQGAATNQAIYILRERTGRPLPRLPGWVPHLMYSHLMLVDYLDEELPWQGAISAADRNRLRWASDPACFEAGCFAPCHPFPYGMGSAFRWPYSSSLQVVPAVWDRSPAGSRVTNASNSTYFWSLTNSTLGPGKLSEVAFPSRKVLAHDARDRHSGHPVLLHFANPEARLPILFADGRARVKHTASANPGWQPNQPASPLPTTLWTTDEPHCEVGQQLPSMPQYQVSGTYRFTRGGLAGRDFAGAEINTGQQGGRASAEVPALPASRRMESVLP